jgi:VIT1/CCC1 family predicted Fe2+/Mn2+ transporter
VYRKLADVEERHATLWEGELRKAGGAAGHWRPGLRWQALRWLAKRFGARTLLPLVAFTESRNQAEYDDQPEAKGTTLPADERSHAKVLNHLLEQRRHRTIGGNALRAAVLGANDGLVSNLSLVMGVAGAQLNEHAILITGIAGLLAGSSSMAIGEWISVQSSRELHERQLTVEAQELALSPNEEQEELSLLYQAKGFSEKEAGGIAERLMENPGLALETLAREELGIDPNELGGSAWQAAWTSFVLFAFGAAIPLVPFWFLHGNAAVFASVAASAAGLFGLGAAATLITGRPAGSAGLRQLSLGLAAAGLTFVIGRWLGVSLN